ncbi:MAG: hypothetical protein A3G24_20570 [Betaproteobacteria bacterium RIFCSPLOWO2_12_FULL_62_13]|nr:MAG: hypothetical protein A3G24_20570 [Betaproteobacteria bacterium RIFCSPLOWO2_12_FULL_62_13]
MNAAKLLNRRKERPTYTDCVPLSSCERFARREYLRTTGTLPPAAYLEQLFDVARLTLIDSRRL